MEELKKTLAAELKRSVSALPNLDPTSEEYGRVLMNVSALEGYIRYWGTEPRYTEAGALILPPAAEALADVEAEPENEGEALADAEAEPENESEAAPWEEPAPTLKKEDVRAQLAEARLKGVDVSKLIADVGAANLSGVDPSRYGELLKNMNAALKELG